MPGLPLSKLSLPHQAELQRWSSRESLGVFALSPGRVQKSSEKSTAGLSQNSENTQSLVGVCMQPSVGEICITL